MMQPLCSVLLHGHTTAITVTEDKCNYHEQKTKYVSVSFASIVTNSESLVTYISERFNTIIFKCAIWLNFWLLIKPRMIAVRGSQSKTQGEEK
jgi:hypothetical protein